MKTLLAPVALGDLKLLLASATRGSGMLFGRSVGKVTVIERLFPVPPGAWEPMITALAGREDELVGVYFLERRPRLTDWMLGRLVMSIREGQAALATCEWHRGKRTLVPLLEEADA